MSSNPRIQYRASHGPSIAVGVQQRAGGASLITGYAAVFFREGEPGTEYQIYDDLIERIAPTAFNRAIREDDVRGLFNHDGSRLLGRTKSGTLRLSVDTRGLRFEIDPPDTDASRDLIELIRRGDVSGCSFSFLPIKSSWRTRDGKYIVTREEVRLFDVGPVTFPAYTGTEAAVRFGAASMASLREEAEEWARGLRPSVSRVAARARAVEVAMQS